MLMYSNIWKRGGAWEGVGPAGNLNRYKLIGLYEREKLLGESLQIFLLLATPFLDPLIPSSCPPFFYIFLLFWNILAESCLKNDSRLLSGFVCVCVCVGYSKSPHVCKSALCSF